MSDGRGTRARRAPRRSRGRRERSSDPAERAARRRLRRARKRVHQRVGFVTHLATWAATLLLLLVVLRSVRLVLVVGLAWGIGLLCHYLWAVAAPRLRDRWIEQRVGEQTARGVESERRTGETRRRRSMEDLSASIAHEIRNPITAAKSLVQQMGEDPASRENLEYAGLALSELDRVERSISHLLRYARDEALRFEPISLRDVATAAVGGLRERTASAAVALEVDFDGPARISGDAEKLRRVVENLIGNAIEAPGGEGRDASDAEGAGPTRVVVQGGRDLAGRSVWLRVVDDGPGIALADRERIWSPFYTTKAHGTGLGLALSRKTVEAHGGTLELAAERGGGTAFVLSFPEEGGGVRAGDGNDEEEDGETYDAR